MELFSQKRKIIKVSKLMVFGYFKSFYKTEIRKLIFIQCRLLYSMPRTLRFTYPYNVVFIIAFLVCVCVCVFAGGAAGDLTQGHFTH